MSLVIGDLVTFSDLWKAPSQESVEHPVDQVIGCEGEKVHFKAISFHQSFKSADDESVSNDLNPVESSEGILSNLWID